jgi:hypothetical protein
MRIRISALRALAGIALLGTLGGCIFTSPDVAAFLKSTSGSNQEVAPNAQASKPLTVIVRDQDGDPMENVNVSWFIKSGGGSLGATQSTTDGEGQASNTYTAGASTGSALIIAEVPALGAAVTFTVVVK